jgi:anti-anti-sigma regulatory factor
VGNAIARLQLGDHVCLPFGSDDERFAAFATFAAAGIAGQFKMLMLTAVESVESLHRRLAERVAAFREASTAGQIQVVASQDRYLVGGRFEPDRLIDGFAQEMDAAEAEGYAGLWVNADMAWALEAADGRGPLVDYEADANILFAAGRMAAVCQYDRRLFDAATVAGVCSAHPIVDGGATLRFVPVEDPPGLLLSGELDGTNQRVLASVLAPLSRVQAALTIDATGVVYAGVSGAAMLIRLAHLRAGRVTTIVCGPQLGRLLRLLDPAGVLAVRGPDGPDRRAPHA